MTSSATVSQPTDPESRAQRHGERFAPGMRLVFVGFGILIVVLAAVTVPQLLAIQSTTQDLSDRWLPARLASSTLLVAFVNQETAARGYVITGDPQYLGPYRDATPQIVVAERALQRALADTADGPRLLARVDNRFHTWQERSARPEIALVTDGRKDAAQQLVASGRGKSRFDELRRAHGRLAAFLDARVRSSNDEVRDADDRLIVAFVLSVVAAVLVVLGARVWFVRWARRLDRQTEIERQLARQTELLVRITNTTSDPIFLKDPGGRYVFVNDGAAQAMGGEPSAAYLGRSDREIFSDAEIDAITRDDDLVRDSHEIVVFEETVGGRTFQATKAPFVLEDGRTGVLGVARDVSEQVEQRARLEAVATLTAAIATKDSVDDMALAVRDVLARVTGADVLWIMVASPDRRGLHAVLKDGTHVSTDQDWSFLPSDAPTLTAEAFRTHRPRVAHVDDVPADSVSRGIFTSEHLQTVAYIPYPEAASIGGIVNFGWRDRRELSTDAVGFLTNLVAILAEGLGRATAHDLERSAVHAFQRLLLPTQFPDRVQVAVRYDAALSLDVGGDWYDVFSLPGGRLGIAVGDAVGHGVDAAASMGQLRSALRALAMHHSEPAELLTALDEFADAYGGAMTATVGYATFDPDSSVLEYACAGHPPPLVVSAGTAAFLNGGRGAPVGLALGAVVGARSTASTQLEPEALIVMYTDGLVEWKGQSIDDGLEALRHSVEEHAHSAVEDLADAVLRDLAVDARSDDAALLCVRLPGSPAEHFNLRIVASPSELRRLRAALRDWLHTRAVPNAEEVVVATVEAASNAIEHAYQHDGIGAIVVDAVVDGDHLAMTVRDHGRWAQQIRRPDRGRGRPIMEGFMDTVDIRTDPMGTTVRLRTRMSPLQ